ncbi:MAG: spore cortex biosynthesis protein YabQ [Oscillospiraceae bacterium]|nr:spore cortex biosynthesis protein YabQ [Oscillospiraceae bacterium]
MTYGFAISQQLELFLYSLGYGFTLGLYYRLVMTVRKAISEIKAAYIAFDILFCVTATVVTFCFFLVYTDGQVRIISVFAASAGFVVYLLSADFFIKKLFYYPVKLIVKSVKLLFRPLTAMIHFIKKICKKLSVKIKTGRKNKNSNSDEKMIKRRRIIRKIHRRKNKRRYEKPQDAT